MHILSIIAGLLSTRAYAAEDIWGSENPGVQAMWLSIRSSVFDEGDIGGSNVLDSFAMAVYNFVFPLIGGAAVILLIYAGLKMVTGQGKDESFAEAKTIVFYALAGVVLAVLAVTIINYANTFLQTVLS